MERVSRAIAPCGPYLRYNSLLRADFNGNSNYNAFVAKYQHRVSGGLNLRAEYTFGKAMVDGWESGAAPPMHRSRKRASSTKTWHRSTLVTGWWSSAIWDIPVGRGRQYGSGMSRPVDAVVGGWTVTTITTFQTGTPFIMTGA